MLDHAFTHFPEVRFEVGEHNIRSQKAIERLGAEKIALQAIAYHGEQPNNNFVYSLKKEKHLAIGQ
jgi:RimJ/RimL family protein N-acetyltransferase